MMIIDAGVEHAILVPPSSEGAPTAQGGMPEMPVEALLSFGPMATMACLFAS
jgi:hypothetical protein